MDSPSRRTLLTAAAAMAATAPTLAAAQGEEGGDDAVLVLPSRAKAERTRIAGGIGAVLCTGYARAGDRGQALYARINAEPKHAGKFRSADGAWWELAENRLNPFMFGAKSQRAVDDSIAIQAMFDFVAAKGTAYPIAFMGGHYYLEKGLTLPTVPAFVTLDIDGGGAVLITDQPIAIFSRLPPNQEQAMRTINGSHYDIHNFEFQGSGIAGQIGVHIGAAYGNVVRNCLFVRLEYGSIGTFCLGSAWRDNLYHMCFGRALVLQCATGYDSGEVWPGSSEPTSPCHVNVIENCRVFGHPKQKSAFGIFGSNAVRVNGCISEGHGKSIDLHFDFQGSPTVKEFHVDTFHCECPEGVLNFKIRASGNVTIDRLVRSYPAAIYDAWGSVNCEVVIRGLTWLGELPEATGKGPNPNGRWFYHENGNGFGAPTETGKSSGVGFRFEECVGSAWEQLSDPKRWEAATLPYMLHIRGLRRANGGMMEWSNSWIQFASPILFADQTALAGMLSGYLNAKTATVPGNSCVSETFEVPGLDAARHNITLNPRDLATVPPPGIVWNAYIENEGLVTLRLTNVTAAPIALTPGAVWTYSAPRRK